MSRQPQVGPIFFCYARKDGGFALNLAGKLREAGLPIWMDQLDIQAGALWDREVEAALRRATTVLVVLSPSAADSERVADEWSYALDEGRTVVPVLYKPCDVPFRLRRLQYLDFSVDGGSQLERLIRRLSAETSAEVPAETAARLASELASKAGDSERTSMLEGLTRDCRAEVAEYERSLPVLKHLKHLMVPVAIFVGGVFVIVAGLLGFWVPGFTAWAVFAVAVVIGLGMPLLHWGWCSRYQKNAEELSSEFEDLARRAARASDGGFQELASEFGVLKTKQVTAKAKPVAGPSLDLVLKIGRIVQRVTQSGERTKGAIR